MNGLVPSQASPSNKPILGSAYRTLVVTNTSRLRRPFRRRSKKQNVYAHLLDSCGAVVRKIRRDRFISLIEFVAQNRKRFVGRGKVSKGQDVRCLHRDDLAAADSRCLSRFSVPNVEFIVMPSRVAPLVMRLGQLTIPELMYSALS